MLSEKVDLTENRDFRYDEEYSSIRFSERTSRAYFIPPTLNGARLTEEDAFEVQNVERFFGRRKHFSEAVNIFPRLKYKYFGLYNGEEYKKFPWSSVSESKELPRIPWYYTKYVYGRDSRDILNLR